MKILKIIGIILLIAVIAFLAVGVVAPNDISTERSVTINAPQSTVANEMFQFKNFKNWSPWQEQDPNMKTNIEGNDGQLGSIYSWQGSEGTQVGTGYMEVTERTQDMMKVKLVFTEPFESVSDGVWKAEDMGNHQTKASWGFSTHYSYPWNGLMMLMGMTDMLNKDFDKGLNKLKENIESGKLSATPSAGNYDISETTFAGGNYAGIRNTVVMSDMEKFFSESYETIGKNAGDRISGIPVGIFYKWDEANGNADVAAAFPVKGNEAVTGASMIEIPSSKAYMIKYVGGYSGSMAAHIALTEKLASQNKQPELVIEEYVKNPSEVEDTNQLVTHIYYLYK